MTAPAPVRDPMIWPLLTKLRTCMAVQLAKVDRPVAKFPLYWGGDRPPADSCECNGPDGASGMGWGRWVLASPPQDFSRSGQIPNPACGGGVWSVVLEFGTYRCYPTLTGDGKPPPEPKIDKATAGLLDDAAALRRGVRCCQHLIDKDLTWGFVNEVPISPSGGCAGVALQVRIQQTECKC